MVNCSVTCQLDLNINLKKLSKNVSHSAVAPRECTPHTASLCLADALVSLLVLSTDHGFILANQIRIENFCLSFRYN